MAHYNEICSLKGSLNCMHFLETLDLSHNNLRDLEKLLTYLEKFNFLRTLNLKARPAGLQQRGRAGAHRRYDHRPSHSWR